MTDDGNDDGKNEEENEVPAQGTAQQNEEMVTRRTPAVTADHGTLEVTNRDLHTIALAQLPRRFHVIVSEAFGGGPTLVEECAAEVARRMAQDKIPIRELKKRRLPRRNRRGSRKAVARLRRCCLALT